MLICRVCCSSVADTFRVSFFSSNSEVYETHLCSMCFRLIILKEDSVVEAIRKVVVS